MWLGLSGSVRTGLISAADLPCNVGITGVILAVLNSVSRQFTYRTQNPFRHFSHPVQIPSRLFSTWTNSLSSSSSTRTIPLPSFFHVFMYGFNYKHRHVFTYIVARHNLSDHQCSILLLTRLVSTMWTDPPVSTTGHT